MQRYTNGWHYKQKGTSFVRLAPLMISYPTIQYLVRIRFGISCFSKNQTQLNPNTRLS